MRREIPLAITFIFGLIMLLNNFFTVPLGGETTLATLAEDIGGWVIIVSAFALGLASVNLIKLHGNTIARQRPGWINSLALIVALVAFAGVGIIAFHTDSATIDKLNSNMFNNLLSPLGAAMFALLAFYIGSASYRAFRMRSLEASILLVGAILMMLGRAPIGELFWSKFPVISKWLLNVPNTAGQRAIMMGAAIGAFVTSLRILVGIERGHLGGTE